MAQLLLPLRGAYHLSMAIGAADRSGISVPVGWFRAHRINAAVEGEAVLIRLNEEYIVGAELRQLIAESETRNRHRTIGDVLRNEPVHPIAAERLIPLVFP